MQYIIASLVIGILIGMLLMGGACFDEVREAKLRYAKREKIKDAEINRLQEQLEFYKRQENCIRS